MEFTPDIDVLSAYFMNLMMRVYWVIHDVHRVPPSQLTFEQLKINE